MKKMCTFAFMKYVFSLLIATLLFSCSPKFQERNDFGGGLSSYSHAPKSITGSEQQIATPVDVPQEKTTTNIAKPCEKQASPIQAKCFQKTSNRNNKFIKYVFKHPLNFKKRQSTSKQILTQKANFEWLPNWDLPAWTIGSIAAGLLCAGGFLGLLIYNIFIQRYLDIGFVLLFTGFLQILFGNWINHMVKEDQGGKFFVVVLQLFLTLIAIILMALMRPGALLM